MNTPASVSPSAGGLLAIPAYNEAARLPSFLRDLVRELTRGRLNWEVVVADDGSALREYRQVAECVDQLAGEGHPIRCLRIEQNRGKGHAIRSAWKLAGTRSWVGFVDADGAVSPGEIRRLIQAAAERKESSLFASRIKMKGRTVSRGWRRHLSGRIFATVVGRLIDPDVYDSQCGAKILARAHYDRVVPFLIEDGFAFDVELLAALNHAGCVVEELPVDWTDVPGSKVRLIRDSLRMVSSVWRIRNRQKGWTKNP